MAADARARRVLVFGANGQVGLEVARSLASVGTVTALDRAAADLSQPQTLARIVRDHRPTIVVNAAAYTAVDRAESEPGVAHTVNAVAAGVLAEAADAVDACFVHYSTDYVYDGRKPAPYDETDPVNPLSVYGQSKFAGELFVSQTCRRRLIFRTSWLMAARGTNFLTTMLRLANGQDTIRVVSDQIGAPTSAALVAGVTRSAIEMLVDAPPADPRWGLYHLTAAGETSWHGYATHIFAKARDLGMPVRPALSVVGIATSDYPAAAKRPANSRLSTRRLRSAFAVLLPDWQSGVDEVLGQLAAAGR